MRFSSKIVIPCALLYLIPGALAVSAETLREVVEYTINNNPEVRTQADRRNSAQHVIDEARAGYYPTLDINTGFGYEYSDNPTTRARTNHGHKDYSREELGFQFRQMLFDGFLTKNEVDRTTEATNAEAYGVYGQSELTALEAVRAYLDLLRRIELLGLAGENLEIHKTTNDQVLLRSERGVGKKADVDQAISRLARAETNEKAERGNLLDAHTAFLRVVGKLAGDLEQPESPQSAMPANIDDGVEQAVANNPILKAAEADVREAEAQKESADSPFFPTLHFEVAGRNDADLDGNEGQDDELQAMLRLRYNLFRGGRDDARRKETVALLSQAKDIRDNTHRQVIESMRLSWAAYETVTSQLEFFASHRDASIKTHESYQQQFNIGQRTLLDLLDSANEMFTAKSDYTNAKYDQLTAMFRILAAMGKLNEHLQVALPKEAETIPVKNK
jgi:type I secretion outer membrane protein, TolC family